MDIYWKGIAYNSIEKCNVVINDDGAEINSVITGRYGEQVYQVEYFIKTNHVWHTLFFEITSMIDGKSGRIRMESDGKGHWQSNGKAMPQFQGCIDIDIPLTPLTNTLPINRLKLSPGRSTQIQVLYVDLLEDEIKSLHQKYTRLSENEYQYENVPNDFEARITVDNTGLVVDYPSLFVRDKN